VAWRTLPLCCERCHTTRRCTYSRPARQQRALLVLRARCLVEACAPHRHAACLSSSKGSMRVPFCAGWRVGSGVCACMQHLEATDRKRATLTQIQFRIHAAGHVTLTLSRAVQLSTASRLARVVIPLCRACGHVGELLVGVPLR
jgi:hypothetical protein